MRPSASTFIMSHTFSQLLSFISIFPLLLQTAAADYNAYSQPSYYQPIYYTPIPITSTIPSDFYPYPTSSAVVENKNCTEEVPKTSHHAHPTHTPPHHHSWTYVISGTAGASSGYAIPSDYSSGYLLPIASYANGSYHYPSPTPEKPDSKSEALTTVLTTTSAPVTSQEVSSAGASSAASGTGSGSQDTTTTTTAQSASPTQSGPAEPLFTGGALRVPDMAVWKWNVVVSVLLGLMVMWI